MHATCDVCDGDINLKEPYVLDTSVHGEMAAHVNCFFNLTALELVKQLELEVELISQEKRIFLARITSEEYNSLRE